MPISKSRYLKTGFMSLVKASKNVPKTSQKHQKRLRTVFGPFSIRFGPFSDRFARFSHPFFCFFGVDVVARSFSSIVVVVAAVVVVAVDVVDAVVVDIVVVIEIAIGGCR